MRLERLFASPGWKDVEAWILVNKMESVGRVLNASSWEQNRVAHGARLAFQMMEEMPQATELEFEQMADTARNAIQEDDALDNE
jgi:hypothetical protein